jgi:hypothetical protein
MKAKKLDKKLVLTKKTVANLKPGQMIEVQGGVPNTWGFFCPPADTIKTCASFEFAC